MNIPRFNYSKNAPSNCSYWVKQRITYIYSLDSIDLLDVLELHQINKYMKKYHLAFENMNISNNYKLINKNLVNISDIIDYYKQHSLHGYERTNLLELISDCYLKEDSGNIEDLIDFYNDNGFMMSVLKEKKIVDKYSNHINSVICKYPKNAELFLYEDKTINIPANFVEGKYKEKLFNLYLDNENENSNFVGKIKYDKNISPDSYVQNKIRLKAERKEKEINNKWFKKFDIDTDFKANNDKNSLNITYNQNTILSDKSNSTILNNLIYIFNFVDTNFLITAAINNNNFDLLKALSTTNSSNFYQDDKNNLNDIRSIMDFSYLYDFLQGNQISLEKALSWFFNNYLVNEFNVKCFDKITIETESNKYIEKCEHVVNRIHRILKIYNLYTTDKNFDRELIKLESVPSFEQLPSLNKKYVYITDSKLIEYSSVLFNSMYDDMKELKKQKVENMVKDGILTRDKNTINVKDFAIFKLLKYHFKYGVIPYYWIKCPVMSNKLNEWVKDGKAYFYNKLLTKAEVDYFEYFLSNKFDNGKGLRNMYAHGADENSDESVHKENYTRILFLLCLLVIKINEEFDHEKFFEEYVNEFYQSINNKLFCLQNKSKLKLIPIIKQNTK